MRNTVKAVFLFLFQAIFSGWWFFMPAAITHFRQALRVWDGLEKETGAVPACRDAFLWGAQGPDFLFFHRILSPRRRNLRAYGGRLHREKPSRLLGVMRDLLLKSGDEATESYLSGFLCHYSLDRTAHPFVYSCVQALKPLYPGRGDDFLHNQIESVLDGIVLRSETGELSVDFDLRRTVPKNPEVQRAIARLYAGALDRLYGLKDAEAELLEATRDCRGIFHRLNDPTTAKKAIFEFLERKTGKYSVSSAIRGVSEPDDFDYANVLRSPWRWPPESPQERNESFFDLYDRSVTESVNFIRRFRTAENLSALTLEIPFC